MGKHQRRERPVNPLTAVLLAYWQVVLLPALHRGPPPAPPPGGDERRTGTQCGDSSAQNGCRLSRASRGPRFLLLPDPPARVTSTGCLCYFQRGRGKGRLHISPERLWPGRCPLSEPGPAPAPTQARLGGALERRNPLISTSIYTLHPKIYTLAGCIFSTPCCLDLLPRRSRQPGAWGTPTCPPSHTATPCTPPTH
jgi:hypothetical protein